MCSGIRILFGAGVAIFACLSQTAYSAEVKVLSDGPLEPALTQIVEAFGRESGHTLKLEFGLSPVIHKRITDGEVGDVVIVQPNFIDDLVKDGKVVPGEHPVIGRVGIGLFMRADAIAPAIPTTVALKEALLSADALVFSNVAGGNYFATVLERLGISETVKAKVARGSPADVLVRTVQGKGNDIGVGAMTLILADKRLRLVGPLPDDLQSYLVYAAAMMSSATSPEAGKNFIRFLASPASQAALAAAGAN
jgi:molybdate transport system substrate-binding protein